MNLYFVDALAGKGKTHAAIIYALQMAQTGEKIAIVQPSMDLIDQTYDDITAKLQVDNIQISKYHSGSLTGQVKIQVIEHLNEAPPGVGEVMLITHQTFLSMNYWHNASDWHIIVDEVPQIFTKWARKLPINYKTITDAIQLGETIEDRYAVISTAPGYEDVIRRMAENDYDDEQDKLYQDLAVRLHNSDMWETLVHVDSYKAVIKGSSKGRNSIETYSLVCPEVLEQYKTVTVMGAMFTKSVMYMVWKNKVQFIEHAAITKHLSGDGHNNGGLLTIKYLFEGNWSKTFKEIVVDGKTIYNQAKKAVIAEMKGKDFIYATNNDDSIGLHGGIRLKNISHGINHFQHINHAAFLSALNSNGATFNFMKANNVNPTELTEAQFFQTLYQFVMRTSLRNPDDKSHKSLIVMDKRSAEFLALHFPGCTIEAVDGMQEPEKKKAGRPPKGTQTLSRAEIQKAYRERKKAKKARHQQNLEVT